MSAVVKLGVSGNDDLALIEFADGTILLVGQAPDLEAGFLTLRARKPIHPEHEQVWERS